MDSTEFRKRYAKLTDPVIVTVNGHPIGQWVPMGATPVEGLFATAGTLRAHGMAVVHTNAIAEGTGATRRRVGPIDLDDLSLTDRPTRRK